MITDWHRRVQAEGARARAEARRLFREGVPVAAIARRLGRSPATVYDYLHDWHPSTTVNQGGRLMTRREKAEEMAQVYTDPRARAWIYRQMGVEE